MYVVGWIYTHMHSAVITNHGRDCSGKSDQGRGTKTVPTSIVVKLRKDGLGRCTRSHDPKRNDDGKEADDMQDQNQGLHHWQPFSQECVKEDGERSDGNDQKSAVPSLKYVGFVVEYDQALDNGAC